MELTFELMESAAKAGYEAYTGLDRTEKSYFCVSWEAHCPDGAVRVGWYRAVRAICDKVLASIPQETLTDEQMRLMAHEVLIFNGGITDGVIDMLQRHFAHRPAPAPEPISDLLGLTASPSGYQVQMR